MNQKGFTLLEALVSLGILGITLVAMLPAFALAGAMVLQRPSRWRRLGEVLLVPSLISWWVLVTRPHLSVNPGDGGYWLADALARRFAADARRLFPSFLVPDMATLAVPAVLVAVAALVVWAVVRRPVLGIAMRRAGIAIWLVAAAALVMTLGLRYDRVVEAEAPQVRRHGGSPVPPVGTFSRFSHRNGWRLGDGEGVVMPLRIGESDDVVLEGWLLGTARHGARLEVRWDDGETVSIGVRGDDRDARLRLPQPPGGGRHRLSLVMRCPEHGAGVLDRVVVGEQPASPHISSRRGARPGRWGEMWCFRLEGRGVVLDSTSSSPMGENAADCGVSRAAAARW